MRLSCFGRSLARKTSSSGHLRLNLPSRLAYDKSLIPFTTVVRFTGSLPDTTS